MFRTDDSIEKGDGPHKEISSCEFLLIVGFPEVSDLYNQQKHDVTHLSITNQLGQHHLTGPVTITSRRETKGLAGFNRNAFKIDPSRIEQMGIFKVWIPAPPQRTVATKIAQRRSSDPRLTRAIGRARRRLGRPLNEADGRLYRQQLGKNPRRQETIRYLNKLGR